MVRNLLAAFAALSVIALLAFADPVLYSRARQLGRMANPDITESSGLAWGWANENVIWTHNDKGNVPRIFAVNLAAGLEGTHLAEYRIDCKAKDWEDICSFKTERDSFLVIADVGDNDLKREKYTLFIVKEPVLKKGTRFGKIETVKPHSEIEFTYEDGRNNCEAVAVDNSDPKKPVAILITKSETGVCKAYQLPFPDRKEKGPHIAKLLTKMTIPMVTAMDISPDGQRAMVLTPGDAYEFTRAEGATWADTLAKKARVLEMPIRRQGEAVCFGADGKSLYLTSEGSLTPIWIVEPRPTE